MKLLCLPAFLLALLLLPAVQASTLTIDPATPSYALAPYVDTLEDPDGKLTIADVASGTHDAEFRPAATQGHNRSGQSLNFGYSSSAWWLRLNLDKPGATERMLLEIGYPSLDHAQFYTHDANGWHRLDAGDLLPFSARPLAHRNFVFPLQLASGKQTFYLRVQSDGTITVPLQLWRPDAFDHESQRDYVVIALYFGMLLALMAYNLLLYLSLRERAYLIYVAFVASLALGALSLGGLGNQFLWPDWPAWGNVALPFGFCLAGLFGTQFTRTFLNTRSAVPRHDRVLAILGLLFALTGLAALTLPYAYSALAVSLLGAITPFVVISSGVICLRNGHAGARYFLLAWTLLMIGVSVMGARNIGWLPTNLLTLNAIQIGSALEMLLLSFSLADRIHTMRRERDAAQGKLIEAMSRRLDSVANTNPDIVFYKDKNGMFLGCNKGFESLIGLREHEIIGKTDFDLMPHDKARFLRELDVLMLASGKPRRSEEWEHTADNRRILLEMVKTPLYDAEGEAVGLIGIGRDISAPRLGFEPEQLRDRVFELLADGAALPDILTQIVHHVEQSRGGAQCSILRLDEYGSQVQLGHAPHLPATSTPMEVVPDFHDERVIVEDIRRHPYWSANPAELAQAVKAGLLSCWSEPIRSSKGQVLGSFAIYRPQAGAPSETDIELIQQAANLASIAIERRQAEDLIWRQANYDIITRLPNRRLFRDRLEQDMAKTRRKEQILALLRISLDRFAEVNERLGHDGGDLLLIEVARRIHACARDSDTVARIGGGEFTVTLPQLHDASRAGQVASQIVAALAEPFRIGDSSASLGASIGIALYPEDAADVDGLLTNAAQALRVVQQGGGNGFRFRLDLQSSNA